MRGPAGGLAILGLGAAATCLGIERAGRHVAGAIPEVSSDREIVDAIQEPEPSEEIGPVVVKSIHDLAKLTTFEVVQCTTIEKGPTSRRGTRRRGRPTGGSRPL